MDAAISSMAQKLSLAGRGLFLPEVDFFAMKEEINSAMEPPPASADLRLFDIRNGLVISETGQKDADDFAADFQGLRHFADRIGGSLELGASLYAALHEPG